MREYKFILNPIIIQAESEKEAIDKFENDCCLSIDYAEIECLGGED